MKKIIFFLAILFCFSNIASATARIHLVYNGGGDDDDDDSGDSTDSNTDSGTSQQNNASNMS